jgi:hypothetical protein
MRATFCKYAKVGMAVLSTDKRRECYSCKQAFTIRLYIKDGAEAFTNIPREEREDDVIWIIWLNEPTVETVP